MNKSGFASKSKQSANGAEYESQGQARSEAERVAPGYQEHTYQGLKGLNTPGNCAPSGLEFFDCFYQGRRAPLRFALAPGFHIPRRWRWTYIGEKPMTSFWQDLRYGAQMLVKHPAFTAVAVLECLVLARRATKVDPLTALRYE